MFQDYKEDHERNKAIIAMLYKMAVADNDLHFVEQELILQIAEQMGLRMEDVAIVFANPDDYVLRPPKNEEDRMTILYYLLFTMRIDGVIKPAEEKLCYEAGLQLGFHHQLVTDLINIMKKYLDREVPSEELLDAIRKYLN